MSASTTRTAQQPLATGQLWAALAVVVLAVIVALAVTFGSRPVPKTDVPQGDLDAPAAAVSAHDWDEFTTSNGAPKTTTGSSANDTDGYAGPSSQDIDRADHGARDDLGASSQGRRLIPQ